MLSSWPSARCLCLVFFVILAPAVTMCECGFCTHLKHTSNSYFNKDSFISIALLSHLCHVQKSRTRTADRCVEVCLCVFPPVCTGESRQFISFNSRVFSPVGSGLMLRVNCALREIFWLAGEPRSTHTFTFRQRL